MAGRDIYIDVYLTLGRVESGSGNLGDNSELSRRHAQIRYENGAAIIEDLSSSNSTFVNSTRITGPQRLNPGDEVEVGMSTLRYVDSSATVVGAPRPTPPQQPAARRCRRRPHSTRSLPARPPRHRPRSATQRAAGRPARRAGARHRRRRSGGSADRNTRTHAREIRPRQPPPLSPSARTRPARQALKTTQHHPGHFLFITSACENDTAPWRRSRCTARQPRQTVWYVITDDSTNRRRANAPTTCPS